MYARKAAAYKCTSSCAGQLGSVGRQWLYVGEVQRGDQRPQLFAIRPLASPYASVADLKCGMCVRINHAPVALWRWPHRPHCTTVLLVSYVRCVNNHAGDM